MGCIDTTGSLSVSELLAVLEKSEVVVSTDSGPFHIAGALGRPVIGLFRSIRPEHATRYKTARVLFGRDSACDGVCNWDFCQNVPCRQMSSIEVEDIVDAATSLCETVGSEGTQ